MSGTINNQFNTGRDCSVVILHPLAAGGRIDLPLLTDFDAKGSYHDIKVSALDGNTRNMQVPENGMLSFSTDRTNAVMETFCWTLWNSYKDTGRLPDGQVFQYIRERDGSTTTIQYTGFAFKVLDLGSWKKDSQVTQKMSATFINARLI